MTEPTNPATILTMPSTYSRRDFLNGALAAAFGAVAGGSQGIAKARDLIEQHETWQEATRPNDQLLARHAADLRRLRLGASFAPEQWPRRQQDEALQGLQTVYHELGVRQLRLGLRWDRSASREGGVSLDAYRPFLDFALGQSDMDVALDLGPIRVFRWPEDHVPWQVLKGLSHPSHDHARIGPDDELAKRGLEHVDMLFAALRSEYGDALSRVSTLQLENEPFYPMGDHSWTMSNAYLTTLADHFDAALPGRDLLVTSAGRLNLHSVRDLHEGLLAKDERRRGRLRSGFDFHYLTPKRDKLPVLRYMDQLTYALPFSPTTEGHIADSRRVGFRIEVTEAQAEPYAYLTSPGNSARGFRYVILRCLDKVLDPREPALIRIWGVELLSQKMLRGQLTDEHRQIIALFQAVNEPAAPAVNVDVARIAGGGDAPASR